MDSGLAPPRRVITGLDADGRSCLLFDGPSPQMIWTCDRSPADNRGIADTGGGPFRFPRSGSHFAFADFPPGSAAGMHATDSIDYIVVVAGEVAFITETGETLLKTGDVLVDRGVLHAWRNDGDTVCRIMLVLCPALPLQG